DLNGGRSSRGLQSRVEVAVVPTVEVPENAISRARREYLRVLCGSRVDNHSIVQHKEKRFVFADRSAEAQGSLMSVGPIRLGGFPGARLGVDSSIVGPC